MTLFRLQPARDPRSMVIEEVRAIFAPPNFLDPISSFTAGGEKPIFDHWTTA